ncbi:MAG: RecQ family ATP-dependent DNA helicase [Bdellovibrionia bacterium]
MKEHFGFAGFRVGQREVLESIWAGQSVLALMPTGNGKSLCFQFPAKVREGLVLVVSPLIALMQDQVIKAKQFGVDAVFINSSLSREERELRMQQLKSGRYSLLFVTPERFRQEEFWQSIAGRQVQLFAVDEAHCISQWGHDFRPDYAKLGEIRKRLGDPPTVALTATATPQVQQDILKSLRLEGAPILHSGIERPNLRLSVEDVYGLDEKIRAIVGLHFQNPGPCIVYVSLIQTLKKIESELNKLNITPLVYHGDLPSSVRSQNLKKFILAESPLMLATPAFGLGIDKADVRVVIHAETPGSLEAYFQEVGRAGRDGKESRCVLLYDPDDVSIQMEFLKWSHPEENYIRRIYELIRQRGRLDQDKFDFLREQLSFKNKHDYRPEAAVAILERWGCIQRDDMPFPYRAVEEPTAENFLAEDSQLLLKSQNTKLLEMVQFAQMQEGCRLQRIYTYFGHPTEEPCGVCDLCS